MSNEDAIKVIIEGSRNWEDVTAALALAVKALKRVIELDNKNHES